MLPHSFWTQFVTPEIHQPQLSLLAGGAAPPATGSREGLAGRGDRGSPASAPRRGPEKVRESVRFAFK